MPFQHDIITGDPKQATINNERKIIPLNNQQPGMSIATMVPTQRFQKAPITSRESQKMEKPEPQLNQDLKQLPIEHFETEEHLRETDKMFSQYRAQSSGNSMNEQEMESVKIQTFNYGSIKIAQGKQMKRNTR